MTFSGALTLTDLNDFLGPSQACIKPVDQVKSPEPPLAIASAKISIDNAGTYYEIPAPGTAGNRLPQAQINLNDCLACSGCITSAESVLITLQSHHEVLSVLESNPAPEDDLYRLPILSIAPQSLASLAAAIPGTSSTPVGLEEILRRVRRFAQQILGFAHVYDTTFARHIALREHAKEFFERKRAGKQLPMLASACPGWVCYAEKTHEEMIPFLARTKSPQQIMGTLVKEWLSRKWGKKPNQIYHVVVMPCYDKKLEASRQDFYNELYSTRDIDCVITTGELELLMREKAWDLSIAIENEAIIQHPASLPDLLTHPGSSSGSYLGTLVDIMTESSAQPLEHVTKTMRTSDYQEHILRNKETGEVVFKGAICYGFRNLQNLVRKVGRDAGMQVGHLAAVRNNNSLRARTKARQGIGTDDCNAVNKVYDYVEVMACPSGCVNGGGQLKPAKIPTNEPKQQLIVGAEGIERDSVESGGINSAKWSDKAWTARVEAAYWNVQNNVSGLSAPSQEVRHGMAERLSEEIIVDLCHPSKPTLGVADQVDDTANALRIRYFRTEYHAVKSEIDGLAVKW